MKRILTAGVLAIGIHGLLLGMNFNLPGSISVDRPKSLVLDMALTSIPMKKIHEPSLQKPKQVRKKPKIVKQKKKKTKQKRIFKAPPKKSIQIADQSIKREVQKTTPEKTADKTVSHTESEQTESKPIFKTSSQTAEAHSPIKMMREAKPLYRSNPPPKYPRIAKIRGYQGIVLLDVLVNKDGRVDDLKIFKSSGSPLLDKAAISAVKRWLFEPGMMENEKVDMWVRVPIRFELK